MECKHQHRQHNNDAQIWCVCALFFFKCCYINVVVVAAVAVSSLSLSVLSGVDDDDFKWRMHSYVYFVDGLEKVMCSRAITSRCLAMWRLCVVCALGCRFVNLMKRFLFKLCLFFQTREKCYCLWICRWCWWESHTHTHTHVQRERIRNLHCEMFKFVPFNWCRQSATVTTTKNCDLLFFFFHLSAGVTNANTMKREKNL